MPVCESISRSAGVVSGNGPSSKVKLQSELSGLCQYPRGRASCPMGASNFSRISWKASSISVTLKQIGFFRIFEFFNQFLFD